MEGKTNFSRQLKQFDGLTRLTPTPPPILRQIYAVVLTYVGRTSEHLLKKEVTPRRVALNVDWDAVWH